MTILARRGGLLQDLFDLDTKVAGSLPSLFRILLETPAEQRIDPRRHSRGESRVVRLLIDDRRHDLRGHFAAECLLARQHLVEHAPNAQMSARLSTALPRACSGDM